MCCPEGLEAIILAVKIQCDVFPEPYLSCSGFPLENSCAPSKLGPQDWKPINALLSELDMTARPGNKAVAEILTPSKTHVTLFT